MNSTNELICPYCHTVQQCHELDEIDAMFANTICEKCNKLFEYSVTVTREYTSSEMEQEEYE